MKKLILIVACLGLASTGAYCQNSNTTAVKSPVSYVCPKCKAASVTSGVCTHCQIKMVKLGNYYCPKCYNAYPAEGKCKKCDAPLLKMTLAANQ